MASPSPSFGIQSLRWCVRPWCRAYADGRTGWRRPPRDRHLRQIITAEAASIPEIASMPKTSNASPGSSRLRRAARAFSARNVTPACPLPTVVRCRSPHQRRLCERAAQHASIPRAAGRPAQQHRVIEEADNGRFAPTSTAPPSTIRSIRPSRSICTWAAVVGETWPESWPMAPPPGGRRHAGFARHRVGRNPDRDGRGRRWRGRRPRNPALSAAPASAAPARTPRPARRRCVKAADRPGGGYRRHGRSGD